ncbi:MAG: class I SAM-dependent methyltransferase [Nocardioidaceae bacterium]|nr:class I SAM-dependent methyltransferase [Nocardioidaceae bacterium]
MARTPCGKQPQDLAAAANVLAPDDAVVATDLPLRFVELTAARGTNAYVADVMRLPWADSSFDAVVAMWMRYHVPDLHQGLAEIRRALRPGGVFVAATNGNDHLVELLTNAGGRSGVTSVHMNDSATPKRGHRRQRGILGQQRELGGPAARTAVRRVRVGPCSRRAAPPDCSR